MSEGKMTRRDFLATTAAVGATFVAPGFLRASQGRSTIRVGLIGCGGRGTGAVMDAVGTGEDVVLYAMADVFEDRLAGSANYLKEQLKERYQVEGRRFVGFDAYKAVMEQDLDVVILTTPPGFRPAHLSAAIEAGKHVFMEKPVAVDGPGIRQVLEAADAARQRGLNIVAGTQRRHDVAYREAMERIHAGAMGDVVAAYCYWNQGGLWMNPRKPEWSDMEWQLRNWLYFTWLSGDHIVEQHVHNLDVVNWGMGSHPVKAMGVGGRQVRTDPAYGHIYDHFAIEFEYENGVRMLSMCRQQEGTASRVAEHLVGTKGTSNANTWIQGEQPWRFDGERPNPYVEEHRHLIQALRGGSYINEGRQVAESTLTAILGRMAAYTGQEVTWEQALNSKENLMPEKLVFGPLPVPPVAMPGKTKIEV
ncbi:MAG: gfo/Idh/MocA family oxidoreductase [Armatimonadetes bacterium]|nr:MAG: gfo/Idh/MocA family oxidoreductase [Armatimonadota bacterium]